MTLRYSRSEFDVQPIGHSPGLPQGIYQQGTAPPCRADQRRERS